MSKEPEWRPSWARLDAELKAAQDSLGGVQAVPLMPLPAVAALADRLRKSEAAHRGALAALAEEWTSTANWPGSPPNQTAPEALFLWARLEVLREVLPLWAGHLPWPAPMTTAQMARHLLVDWWAQWGPLCQARQWICRQHDTQAQPGG